MLGTGAILYEDRTGPDAGARSAPVQHSPPTLRM
jgi:hypothetical protein